MQSQRRGRAAGQRGDGGTTARFADQCHEKIQRRQQRESVTRQRRKRAEQELANQRGNQRGGETAVQGALAAATGAGVVVQGSKP